MKCWVGVEVEKNLNYQNLTIFVEGSMIQVSKLIEVLEMNKIHTASIYFGANQTNLLYLLSCKEDLEFLKKNFKLIVEVDKFFKTVDYSIFDNIIIRVDNKDTDLDINKVSLKLRDQNDAVYVVNLLDHQDCSTSLKNLDDNGMFESVDKIIYED